MIAVQEVHHNLMKVQEKLGLWLCRSCCHITFDNTAFLDYLKQTVKMHWRLAGSRAHTCLKKSCQTCLYHHKELTAGAHLSVRADRWRGATGVCGAKVPEVPRLPWASHLVWGGLQGGRHITQDALQSPHHVPRVWFPALRNHLPSAMVRNQTGVFVSPVLGEWPGTDLMRLCWQQKQINSLSMDVTLTVSRAVTIT